jgi:hypothetical protein
LSPTLDPGEFSASYGDHRSNKQSIRPVFCPSSFKNLVPRQSLVLFQGVSRYHPTRPLSLTNLLLGILGTSQILCYLSFVEQFASEKEIDDVQVDFSDFSDVQKYACEFKTQNELKTLTRS